MTTVRGYSIFTEVDSNGAIDSGEVYFVVSDASTVADLMTGLQDLGQKIDSISGGVMAAAAAALFPDISGWELKTSPDGSALVARSALLKFVDGFGGSDIPTLDLPTINDSQVLSDGFQVNILTTEMVALNTRLSDTSGDLTFNDIMADTFGTILPSFVTWGQPTNRFSYYLSREINLDDYFSSAFVPDPSHFDSSKLCQPRQPYSVGIPVPFDSDITTGTKVSLCFNQSYLPWILGALKGLEDITAYNDSNGTIIDRIIQFQRIPELIEVGCIDESTPDWKLQIDPNNTGTWRDATSSELAAEGIYADDHTVYGIYYFSPGNVNWNVRGVLKSDGSVCGGIFKFAHWDVCTSIPDVNSLTTVNCLDFVNNYISVANWPTGAPHGSSGQVGELKELEFGTPDLGAVVLFISGNHTCVGA